MAPKNRIPSKKQKPGTRSQEKPAKRSAPAKRATVAAKPASVAAKPAKRAAPAPPTPPTAPKPRRATRQTPARPIPPRPPMGNPPPMPPIPPRPLHGRAPETEEHGRALAVVPDDLGRDMLGETFYPLFPTLAAGTVESIRVYRTTAREGEKGHAYHEQALPWQAASTSWHDISRICGGGRFVVQAIARGKVIASAARTFEGPARMPTARDVASISPGLGLAENGSAVYETPNGWISIPGIDGPTQAAFITFQQTAFNARDDANKANAAMAMMLTQLVQKAMQIDPGIAVLQNVVEAQRITLERVQGEISSLRSENVRLKIEGSTTGTEEQRIKVEAIRKGLDIVDGVAGAVAKKFLEQGTAPAPATPSAVESVASATRAMMNAGTAADLGAAMARRAMQAALDAAKGTG